MTDAQAALAEKEFDMEQCARFGHHPDPAVDFCVEVDAIEAEVADLAAGLAPTMNLRERIDRAMDFRVGGSPEAVRAKAALRKLAAREQR